MPPQWKHLVAHQYLGRGWISTWMNILSAHFEKTGCNEIHLCKRIQKTPPKREWNKIVILALCEISAHGNIGLCACILSLSRPMSDFCMTFGDQFYLCFHFQLSRSLPLDLLISALIIPWIDLCCTVSIMSAFIIAEIHEGGWTRVIWQEK